MAPFFVLDKARKHSSGTIMYSQKGFSSAGLLTRGNDFRFIRIPDFQTSDRSILHHYRD